MKKLFVILALMLVVLSAFARNNNLREASDLFISEYIEGSSNNKAIEIFNGTGSDVDLSAYTLKKGGNGGNWANDFALSGTLVNGDVYVIYNASSVAEIANEGDVTSSITYFNGDDAIGLFNGDTLIDVIGEYQSDPGSGWSVAGIDNATKDHTLVRKATIAVGNTDWSVSAGTNSDDSEWIVYDQDDFSYIGSHSFDDSGVPFTAAPVFTPAAGTYFSTQNVELTSGTENATIYYTVDGSDPTESSAVYTTAIEIAETTTIKAFATAEGYQASSVMTAEYEITSVDEVSIYEIQHDEVTGFVAVSGIVTAIKDGSEPTFCISSPEGGAWNGIYVNDDSQNVSLGDDVSFYAEVVEQYGFTQLNNVTNFQILSSENDVPAATVVTPEEMNTEAYEGVLVKLENVTLTTEASNYGEWYVTDGTNEAQIDDDFYGECETHAVVGTTYESITGVVDYAYSHFGLQPRSAEDIVVAATPEFSVVISADVTEGNAPLTVNLTSTVTNGTEPYTYAWSTGETEANIAHVFDTAGSFDVTLTVTDSETNEATSNTIAITVNDNTPQAATIYQIQHDNVTGYVAVSGIVTAIESADSPYFCISSTEGGAWNGIYVRDNSQTVALGDEVSFNAEVTEYFDYTQLQNLDTFVTVSTGNDIPAAVVVSIADMNTEAYEGVLTTIENVTVSEGPDNFGQWKVTDGTNEAQIDDGFFDNCSDYAIVGTVYDSITGILDYSHNEFGLNPRNAEDFIAQATEELSVVIAADVIEGNAPLTVNFTSTVTNGTEPYTYAWSTGETEANIAHVFDTAGSFDVTLTVTDSETNEATSNTISITVNDNTPQAATIYQIQHDNVTGYVAVSGIVTAIESADSPYFCISSPEGGAWNGIYVRDNSQTVALGDEVSFNADVTEYFDYTQLQNLDTFVTVSTGNTIPAATVVTLADMGTEAYEGVLTTIENVTVSEVADEHGQWKVTDGTNEAQIDDVFFDNCSDFAIVGTVYDSITGIVDFGFGEFGLNPRNAEDLVEHVSEDFEVSITSDVTSGTAPLTVNFTSNVINGSEPYTYAWSTGETEANIAHVFTDPGTYDVTLTVTDATDAPASESKFARKAITRADAVSNTITITVTEEIQNPGGLFISEYIEGSSNNKAIELFNATGADLDLTGYVLKLGSNGNEWGNTCELTGTLAAEDVYVIMNGAFDEAYADVADVTSNVTWFNGDDALALFYNDQIIDVFGVYQEQPDNGWAIAGIDGASGEQTLVRKPNITEGTTDWATSAGTTSDDSQWIIYDQDDFSHLGSHEYSGGSGNEHAATPTFTPAGGDYTEAVDVTIATTTEDAIIYYTLDGTTPDNTSTEYTSALNISANTTLKAIAYKDGLDPSFIATAVYNFITVTEVATLSELRTQETDTDNIYVVTGEVFLTYQQDFRHQKWIQDENAGIIVDDNAGKITTAYNVADGISNIKGKLVNYNGLLEFVPTHNWETATSTANEITPIEVSLTDLNANHNDYQSRLVKIEAAFTTTGNFEAGTMYPINGIGSETEVTYNFYSNFYDADYINTAIPETPREIIGLVGHRNDGDFIVSRDASEMSIEVGNEDNNAELLNSELLGNYPNPFNPETTINYNLKKSSNVRLNVYNILGQKVRTLVNKTQESGLHNVVWNGKDDNDRNVASGIYFYRLSADNYSSTKKMVLMK